MGRRSIMHNGRRAACGRRIAREKKTVEIMIEICCRDHHNGGRSLCPECVELLDYSLLRLDRCPFGERKPPCAKCEIHCYKPAQRRGIVAVMRYSGPKMLTRYPILAIRHLRDAFSRPKDRAVKSGP